MATLPGEQVQAIIEAALMVAGRPLTIAALQQLFTADDRPSTSEIKAILITIKTDREKSGIELQEVANGYRFQTKADLSPWLSKLWEERSPRYSRALLETLAIIAYKQPITRAEIEEIRGVTVSSTIMKTLQEREWIRLLGYREVPGKPAIYGTTKEFLDYFNLKSLVELPALAELNQLALKEAQLQIQLAMDQNSENNENDETNENDENDERDQSQNQNIV
jgi:segregation and condensation protein B